MSLQQHILALVRITIEYFLLTLEKIPNDMISENKLIQSKSGRYTIMLIAGEKNDIQMGNPKVGVAYHRAEWHDLTTNNSVLLEHDQKGADLRSVAAIAVPLGICTGVMGSILM